MNNSQNGKGAFGHISRRGVLKSGAAAMGSIAALGPTQAFAQGDPVRFGIYGSANKLEIRGNSIAKFAELHPEVPVVYEGVPSAAWPDKIAAMIAGGNAPDVITLGSAELAQYATRNVLEPLEAYVPEFIQADLFPPAVLELGKVDGVLYGLPIAVSIQAMGYNQSALDRLGMELPDAFTYESFAEYCAEIHSRDETIYGCHDGGARLTDFDCVLRAQDRVLIEDEKLSVTVEEVAEWLDYWNMMRASGAAVPAEIQAAYAPGEWTNAPMVLNKAVFGTMQTQDLKSGLQALTDDTLAMMAPPAWGEGHNGTYPSPSSSVTMNVKSNNKEDTAVVMNWFVNSPDSGRILRLISGPPASTSALQAVLELSDLDRLDKNVLAYAQSALAVAKPAPPVHRASRALDDLMKRMNEDVGFGRATVQEAAENFITRGNVEIRRS